jgi:hypothetical protein
MKITNEQLKKIIKEELSLLESAGAQGQYTGPFFPVEIHIYSPNTKFDYGMQQEWDMPFPEGRTHYFDLRDRGEFKQFINFLFSLRNPSGALGGSVHDNHIILDEDANDTFNTHSGRSLPDNQLRALDGKEMKNLLYTDPFKLMLPINKQELITAGMQLHNIDLTSTLKPINI